MLDLHLYQSLGEALRAALDKWPNEICLIEADRDRENHRLTYAQFRDMALPLARALQDAGFQPGSRAAILMTNQSKWLISAYAIFFCGGILVPIDYKFTAMRTTANSGALQSGSADRRASPVARAGAGEGRAAIRSDYRGGDRSARGRVAGWRQALGRISEPRQAGVRDAPAEGSRVHRLFVGNRRTPQGLRADPRKLSRAVHRAHLALSFLAGVRYLSILPTNHAIDFMVGFIGPFVCGATVVHLRTLRPEYVREAFSKYKITYVTLVPLVLKNLERGLRERFDALPKTKRRILDWLIDVNRSLTRKKPRLGVSRKLLGSVHKPFGGELRAIFVGGAFTEPATLQFFYDLGIPVGNGYGCTEAGTVITLNDFHPFRADTVGKPLPGVEVAVVNADADGIGEIKVRGKTVMSHYLDDPEMTAETIVAGSLMTGDLGRFDSTGHLQLFGRKKNMIVTEEGKNIYPEDVETVFEGFR
jgi:long-chain acyl-CoA synthetase